MEKIIKFIDNINEWVGRIFSFIVVVLTILVVLEVIMRKFFNHPTIWSFDITIQLYGCHFMILGGYTLLHRGHVSIDIFSQKFSEKTQAFFEVICYIVFFFPFWLVVLSLGIRFAGMSWKIYETGIGIFPIPLYIIKTIIPLSALLICLQGLSDFWRKILILKTK